MFSLAPEPPTLAAFAAGSAVAAKNLLDSLLLTGDKFAEAARDKQMLVVLGDKTSFLIKEQQTWARRGAWRPSRLHGR